ncbi:sialate O-acetylesterase [Petroclostridium sp. X23]|uniref:sialate O-acetylesterase n=1 Tax=Petroclostridium sp. X23 TaxID=3045146 RepID=UPI0024AE2E59|nr:sialate O-acetylesterase [Petroclostridium sp. X23]WHH58623.1 sialate O-acetylesterase [Petroclostridium sp. X23]
MSRTFIRFLFIGVFLVIFCVEVKASEVVPNISDGQDISDGYCYFHEAFSDKSLKNNRVLDKRNKTIWQINNVEKQTNTITDTGALELGGARYMQRAALAEDLWAKKQNYAMEFTINVQKVGNEGHSGRPIAVVIPRSKDKDFNEYYAVTYYMQNTVANQFKFKWAIINTAAPTKMKPLAEGYYLLRENVDYTARLFIQNTYEDNVSIKFYIDGPTNPMKEYKPLLEYTDTSEYRIKSGVTGPAFGTVGYTDSSWGTPPVVRYDNINLYDVHEFEKYEEQLKKYISTNPQDIVSNDAYGQIKYVINRGILDSHPDNTFRPYEHVSVAEFIKMLLTLKGEKYPEDQSDWADHYMNRGIEFGIIKENEFPDYNKAITKYDVALMLTRFNGNLTGDKKYASFIRDYKFIPSNYQNAALYTYNEGYLRLSDSFRFMGDSLVSRADTANIILRVLDAGIRKVNYNLELPNILSSGAVLQGNKKIPVWGRGVSGETITVKFKKQTKTTTVKNGHWYLELDPEPYGGPYTLTVNNTKDTITLNNIQVGEVFVVAGQSNAEMFLYECYGAEETRKKFEGKSNLRFYSGEQITAVTPNFTSKGQWEYSEGWAIDYSSAIGTFFAEKLLELNKQLNDVTIGIIRMTYGGTTVEAFMPNAITEESGYIQRDDEPIMSGFWNGFMEPITPFAIKGVIYYQGENSTHLGYKYESLLRDYLRGLRMEFKDSHLPAMLVQLAGYSYNDYETDRNEWPIIRDVQMRVAGMDNTGLVTAIDLSDKDPIEIHPKEKKEIGRRLAYLAMDLIYGKQIEGKSAKLKYCEFEGNKAIIGFDNHYGRIYFKKDIPKDFQVLDKQGKWHMANAIINTENNTVEVWHDEILEPAGVRYAWVNYPNISLYNDVDMPVLPFRVVITSKTTEEKIIKISNHLLKANDAVVNTQRNNQFRTVQVIGPDIIAHEYAIQGQAAGDTIEKFSKQKNLIAQEGTTETIIKIPQHGLCVGDWIRNNTRGWEPRRVNAVLDEDTIEVSQIKGQSVGDDIGIYQFIGISVAE